MKRLFCISLICFLACASLKAQIVTWSIKPGTYTSIEPCWENLFYIYKGNSVGVADGNGHVIVSPDADRITGFYNGLALVLKSDSGQERILGILSAKGSYTKVDGTYFTIPYQEFFSENLLTIIDSNGKAGYMNANGVVVKSFNTSFVSPFSEGYAVVGEDADYSIVDKRFNELTIQLGTVASVYGGSNVYNGEAIVMDSNGKYHRYNVKSGRSESFKPSNSLDYDYLYCFTCLSGRGENVPYEQTKRLPQSLEPVMQDGKYGYANAGKTILPYQLDEAECFYGDNAIVKLNGEYGLLALDENGGQYAAKSDANIKYRKSSGKNLKHRFEVSIPSQWDKAGVMVKLRDENGMSVDCENDGNSYEFAANGATGTRKYWVEIDGDGLNLWNGEIEYKYIVEADPVIEHVTTTATGNLKPLTITLKSGSTQADKNNRCYIYATIHNPNSDAITTTVTMKGSNLLEAVNKQITIPAYGSKDISTYFTVTKAVKGQNVTVTTTAGGRASLDGLQLIPF